MAEYGSLYQYLSAREDGTLRGYQSALKSEVYASWRDVQAVMLQMPTGTGKTRVFCSIVKDIEDYNIQAGEKMRVLLLAHRKELISQIAGCLGDGYGIGCTLITAGRREDPKLARNVCVGSVPTMTRRMDGFFTAGYSPYSRYYGGWGDVPFDFIIVDEAHHIKADSYKHILGYYPGAKLLGVTATPHRMNDAGFTSEFGRLVLSPPVGDFICEGWLCDYVYYSVREKHTEDAERFVGRTPYGDFQESKLYRYMYRNGMRRANVVGTYLRYARGKKGLVYCINIEDCRQLCDEFLSCGVTAAVIDTNTPQEEREAIIDLFKAGRITVLCNVNIFTEGFDCPDIEFVQLARPTLSMVLYLQQIGRALRPCDGKERAIVLDNAMLYRRFGLPARNRDWERYFSGNDGSHGGGIAVRLQFKGGGAPLYADVGDRLEVIESTGIQKYDDEAKSVHADDVTTRLSQVITDICRVNERVYKEHVEGYADVPFFSFSADFTGDLFSPIDSISAHCENVEGATEWMEGEMKPVWTKDGVRHEPYKDLEDFALDKIRYVRDRFYHILKKENAENVDRLRDANIYDFLYVVKKQFGKFPETTAWLEEKVRRFPYQPCGEALRGSFGKL